MPTLSSHLEKLRGVKKQAHHPLLHQIHKQYRISRKTLFYIKEYGPHTHVAKTIIRESLKILLFASVVSSFGGLAIEHVKTFFVTIMPLLILLPTLNDMIGDYGTIVSSKFSNMLHEGEIKDRWWRDEKLKKLLVQIFIIAVLTGVISAMISFGITAVTHEPLNLLVSGKILLITILDVVLLIAILSFTAILAGLHFYKKSEDPNNFLIPITTSMADFGNMIILAILVTLLF